MKSDSKILEIISHETVDTINKMSVVTPSIYASVFSKYAAQHNTDISEEEHLTDEFLNEKIAFFANIQNETSKNAQLLSQKTNQAISAIKEKDENILNEVLKETQNLRYEIEKLKESVYKDELTNAYNRKWVNDNFLDEEAENFNSSGTLAIIDLNYFKEINDTYGHIIGDKVLVFISNQLKETNAYVVRYGGDEFIIIFPNCTTKKTAISKLNTIRDNILKKKIKIKDTSFKVSFSIGAHEFKKGNNLNDVIEKADKNMYNDKIEIKKRVSGI